ncbi:hypothetical protein WMF39_29465 [Sorangium sp. So ce1504]|uniref:hypothetical protein n=1 Tax=Sorangium sp. So ce1504 TaxID=3133337 RepID=UPI003F5D7FBB
MGETMLTFLGSQILHIPSLIAYIAAIALAFYRYPTQGKPALLAGCGFFLFVMGWLINAAHMYWQISSYRNGGAAQGLVPVAYLTGLVSHLLELVGLVLVMLALFGTRNSPVGGTESMDARNTRT